MTACSDLQGVQHNCVPLFAAAQQAPLFSCQAVFNGFIQPSVLAEQLHQLHVHVGIGWPRCELGLEEIEQLVPALLALTTQQTLLYEEPQSDESFLVQTLNFFNLV